MTTHQGTQVEQVCNWKGITWWEPCGQIWTECRESQSSKGHAADQRHLWPACKGVQALASSGSWKKIWEEEVLSLSICLSTHLSHTTETSTLSRIKCERYIFIKKCVHLFIEVRKLCLIMFPLVFVCGYTTLYLKPFNCVQTNELWLI